jgi:hypothetical protein
MSGDEWTWELASKAQDDLAALDSHEQDRILDELDEIVDSPWRDPPDSGEPLQNSPHKFQRFVVIGRPWTEHSTRSHCSWGGEAATTPGRRRCVITDPRQPLDGGGLMPVAAER